MQKSPNFLRVSSHDNSGDRDSRKCRVRSAGAELSAGQRGGKQGRPATAQRQKNQEGA